MKKVEFGGSALVYSLIVLFVMLTVALGVASVSVVEQRNSSATGKSTQAFQVADSAVEQVLKYAALDPTGTTLQNLGSTCVVSNGVAIAKIVISGNEADVTFKDPDGAYIGSCDANLSQVAEVKAVGKYGSTVRAINAAVAAGNLNWKTAAGFSSPWSSNNDSVKCAKDDRTGLVYLKGTASSSSAQSTVGTSSTVFTDGSNCPPPSGTSRFVKSGVNMSAPATALIEVSDSSGSTVVKFSLISGSISNVSLDGIYWSTN